MNPGYTSELFVSFQGEGQYVGQRHLFVRFAMCNLRCRYCDTPDSLVRTPYLTVYRSGGTSEQVLEQVLNPVSAVDLADRARFLLEHDGPVDAVAVTGGEPLVQAEFVAEFLCEARFPIPVLLETNGVLYDRLGVVLPWVAIISMDVKPPSNTGEPPFWDDHTEFLRVAQGKDVYVKVLVDNGTSVADVERAAQLVASGGGAALYLQPIMDATGLPDIGVPHLDRLFSAARKHHKRVRVLPQTHKILGLR